jgi:hypothetical protein
MTAKWNDRPNLRRVFIRRRTNFEQANGVGFVDRTLYR